jgi:hypothetical protein
MGYALHIERTGGFALEEWKRAVASVSGVRLDDSPSTATNPKTGEVVMLYAQDGDVAVMLAGKWVKVFQFFKNRVSFNARSAVLDNPNDLVARAAFSLAHILSAKVVGDGGQEYGYPAGPLYPDEGP